jgi:hypothetical protein
MATVLEKKPEENKELLNTRPRSLLSIPDSPTVLFGDRDYLRVAPWLRKRVLFDNYGHYITIICRRNADCSKCGCDMCKDSVWP